MDKEIDLQQLDEDFPIPALPGDDPDVVIRMGIRLKAMGLLRKDYPLEIPGTKGNNNNERSNGETHRT
ncbi:MAG: hypothetical protein RJS98_00395 [Rhodospirillaceae bacterium]